MKEELYIDEVHTLLNSFATCLANYQLLEPSEKKCLALLPTWLNYLMLHTNVDNGKASNLKWTATRVGGHSEGSWALDSYAISGGHHQGV